MVGSTLSGSSDLARFSRGCQALQHIPLSPGNSTKHRTRCRAACSHAARSIRQPRPACPWLQHRSSPDLLAARHRICGRGVAAIADRRQPRVQSAIPCGLYPAGVSCTAQPTRAAAAAFSSLARTLLRNSPRQLARTLLRILSRVARPLLTGPGSVFVVLLTIVGGVVAAVRARMWSTCRNCKECHGFGIERCSLCRGAGVVGWEGKWSHKELCPSCLGKRFVSCPHCGGHFHRATFVHARARGRREALESMDGFDSEDEDRFMERMVTD